MRKTLNLLARLLSAAAIVLMLLSSTTEELTAGLWGGLCVLMAVLCGFIEDHMKRQDNQKQPVITVEAKVVSRRTMWEKVGRQHVQRYYITFKPEDADLLEFNVSEIDYEDFDVGETGPLRYRGWQFLSFGVTDKSGMKPISPLPEEYNQPVQEHDRFAALQETASSAAAWLAARFSRETGTAPEKPAAPEGVMTHDLDE